MRTIWAISVILFLQGMWLDREQSQIRFFLSEKTYYTSHVRNMFWATILCKFLEIMKFNHTIVSTCCNHIWFIKWFRIDQILYSWFFKERLQLDYKFCVHIPWLNLFNIPARKTWYEVRSCFIIINRVLAVGPFEYVCPCPLIHAHIHWSMPMSIDPCPCPLIHVHVYWSMPMSIDQCPCPLIHVHVH